ncbi:hypothetical protein FACS1894166_03370 [Bacilli bacterium]|nr:hypothetical protein FACS1894166_03370 [Bacilli bacterium]
MKAASRHQLQKSSFEIIKDPMYLEFLGLSDKTPYHESDLETAIINHLQEFLMELGNGFSFVSRQKLIKIEDKNFYIDLVFYNYILKCFVLIDLKVDELTHQDLGQIQMYVNYYDRIVKTKGDKSTVGILLCAKKNNELVKMTLPHKTNIMASEYKIRIPTKEQFIKEIKKVKTNLTNETLTD